jgi:hypothetical protein
MTKGWAGRATLANIVAEAKAQPSPPGKTMPATALAVPRVQPARAIDHAAVRVQWSSWRSRLDRGGRALPGGWGGLLRY